MSFPIQITFRHMAPSPAVESRIREECNALERHFPRIVSGRVVVEAPHRHHQQGHEYHTSIFLSVPRSEIVVKHAPSQHATLVHKGAEEWEKHLEAHPEHKDIYVSVRDAFAAARRQLEDYSDMLRGDVKTHAGPVVSEEAEGRSV